MEALDQISMTLALSMGLAWASGLNLYATLFTLGYLANTGNIDLPQNLQIVADPMVMGAAGIMYLVEFFADKVPGIDTGWDALHTFVRIPAGAMLAAGAIGDLNPAVEITAAILGGRSGSRNARNQSRNACTHKYLTRAFQQLVCFDHGRYCGCQWRLGLH
jgi:hypothetical protein